MFLQRPVPAHLLVPPPPPGALQSIAKTANCQVPPGEGPAAPQQRASNLGRVVQDKKVVQITPINAAMVVLNHLVRSVLYQQLLWHCYTG